MTFIKWSLSFLAGLLFVVASGCATGPEWQRTTGEEEVHDEAGYSVTLPAGWFWMRKDANSPMIATHDGPDLQAIRVFHRDHGKAFPNIGQASSPEMQPRELAELFVAEVRKEHGFGSLEVLENAPAEFGGAAGFRIKVEWRDEGGVRYHGLVYGCATEEGFYVMYYHAPRLHYYAASEPLFESAVDSFHFVS